MDANTLTGFFIPPTPSCSLTFGNDHTSNSKFSGVSTDSGYGASNNDAKEHLMNIKLRYSRANKSCPSLSPTAVDGSNDVQCQHSFSPKVKHAYRTSWPLSADMPELKRYDSGYIEDEYDKQRLTDTEEERYKQQAYCDKNGSSFVIGPSSLEDRTQVDDELDDDDDEDYDDEFENDGGDSEDDCDDTMFEKLPVFIYQTTYRGKYKRQPSSLLTEALQQEPRAPLPYPRQLERTSRHGRIPMVTTAGVAESIPVHSQSAEVEKIQEMAKGCDETVLVGSDSLDPVNLTNGEPKNATTKLWSWWQSKMNGRLSATSVPVVKRDHWESDKSSKNCNFCFKLFTFTRRRHHCRVCGKLFCAECSSGMALLNPATAEPTEDGSYLGRVCTNCHHNFRLKDEDWFTSCGGFGSTLLSSVEALENKLNLRVGMKWMKALMMTK